MSIRNLPVKAAGSSLTVDEISEALAGLRGNDFVTVDGYDVFVVTPSASGIDIATGHDCEAEEYGALGILEDIAKGDMTKQAMVVAAKKYVNGEAAA